MLTAKTTSNPIKTKIRLIKDLGFKATRNKKVVYGLAVVGGYYAFKGILYGLSSLSSILFKSSYNLLNRYANGSKNSYVIITGATGSIGYAYCKALARRGFNILMIARNATKIAKNKEQLNNLYPEANILSIQCDFGGLSDPKNITKLQTDLQDMIKSNNLDISMLINVAGCENFKLIWTGHQWKFLREFAAHK